MKDRSTDSNDIAIRKLDSIVEEKTMFHSDELLVTYLKKITDDCMFFYDTENT